MKTQVKVKNLTLPFSETQLIKGLTPKKAHADELVTITDKEEILAPNTNTFFQHPKNN